MSVGINELVPVNETAPATPLKSCGDDDWLHIYPQPFEHAEAEIVGTVSALTALRDALDEAIRNGKATVGALVTDGEGYWIEIEVSTFEQMDVMTLPYADLNRPREVSE